MYLFDIANNIETGLVVRNNKRDLKKTSTNKVSASDNSDNKYKLQQTTLLSWHRQHDSS